MNDEKQFHEQARRSDASLMDRIGRGDNSACEEIVERHLPNILALARSRIGDEHMAEDIAQEVFLTLWKQAHKWKPDAQLSTWLHRVTINRSIDELRKKRPLSLADGYDAIDDAPGSFEQMAHKQQCQALHKAISTLPERQREVIELCYLSEMKQQEAAEILGISLESVESALRRARLSLLEKMEKPHDRR
ncbi:MAG: sigma-70 family RNA polymerase sigma factor [Parvibaculales bacterium]